MGAQRRLPPRRARLTAGILLAVLLLAGACGGNDDPGGDRESADGSGCAERVPVVVDLHGYSETVALHEQRTGWQALGEAEGFLTVVPQAPGEVSAWDLPDDVATVAELIDRAVAEDCADADRVYVTGHSMGGFLTTHVACALADRVAAVAPVGGTVAVDPCTPERPVPAMIVHGTADQTVPLTGGLSPQAAEVLGMPADGPSIPDLAAAWAVRNGCGARVTESPTPGSAVIVRRWPCPEGADVELHLVPGGGHAWPAGATAQIWTFFQRHARQG